MKVIRCKDCALDGNPECPLSYIEKQTLCFVEHSPMFFCGKAKPTEDYHPTNGDVIRNMTDSLQNVRTALNIAHIYTAKAVDI